MTAVKIRSIVAFEAGKSYHTRGGGLASITKVDSTTVSGWYTSKEGQTSHYGWWGNGRWLISGEDDKDLLPHSVGLPNTSKGDKESDYEQLHEDVRDGFVRTYRTNNAPFNAEAAWKATKLAAGDAS